jgi:hypothetical protein
MHTANFDEALEQIVQKDARYHREAYLFVREALDHTQKIVNKGAKTEARQAAALAQAEMRELVGNLLADEQITMQSTQFGAVRLEGDAFAQVPLVVNFSCAIEKFVNLMAAIANAPRTLSTRQIRISPEQGETKAVRVQLTVAGYLPVSRTPELVKKTGTAGGAF